MKFYPRLLVQSYLISNSFFVAIVASTLPSNNNTLDVRYDHRCLKDNEKDVPYVWCIPEDYSNREEPWRYKNLVNATFPWKYEFRFQIFDIQEVDDRKQTVAISMYFIIKWLEPRIIINETAADWNDIKYGLVDTVDISPELLGVFWNPDLEIYGMEWFHSKTILKEMSSLKILKSRHIEYMARVDIKISCQMDFENYPMDTQNCPFLIGSYYNAEDTVDCDEIFHYKKERQRSLQYSIKIDPLDDNHRTTTFDNKNFSVCGFNILLERTRKQTFYQVYLTSILFVVVSWVSFIIKPELVPGRMGLLVMIFLILITTFDGVKDKAPASKTLNEVDLYLLVCIGMVFFALLEYAIVLLRQRWNIGKGFTEDNEAKRDVQMKVSPIHSKDTDQTKHYSIVKDESSTMNRFDGTSLLIFPMFFMIFNVVYFFLH